MTIFWRLLFAHLVADFTLQTDFVNAWKRKGTWGMLVHAATHLVVSIALCWPHLNDLWIDTAHVKLQGWSCVLIIFLLHFLEDEWRVFSIFRKKMPDNTFHFLWDQVIHVLIILAFSPWWSYWYGGFMPEKWPIYGCLAVMVTHFCTVLLYFIERDKFDSPYPELDEKYVTMSERFVLATAFILPGFWGIAAPAAWGGAIYLFRLKRGLDYSWFSFYVGGLLAVVAGVLVRIVWYS
ncbi:DUF3307 domain-containing protein [Elusimicrobiota bacterium]